MVSVTVLYLLILGVCIGAMGPELASSQAPVQDAFYKAIGPVGMYFVLAGTLLSMGGINFAQAFMAPRIATALSEDGMLPAVLSKRDKKNIPYVAAITTAVLSLLLAWSGKLYHAGSYQCRITVYTIFTDLYCRYRIQEKVGPQRTTL